MTVFFFFKPIHIWCFISESQCFFDERTFLKSSCNFIWKSFLTLRNLIFFTKSTRSSSNGINSLSCRGHLLLFKPYTEPLAQDSVVSLLLFMKKIAFHRNFFMNNSIFSVYVYIISAQIQMFMHTLYIHFGRNQVWIYSLKKLAKGIFDFIFDGGLCYIFGPRDIKLLNAKSTGFHILSGFV